MQSVPSIDSVLWGRYCGKVVKVEILFLMTPDRLRAVTGEILKVQRDRIFPSVDSLPCPSMEVIIPQDRAGRREVLECTA